MAIQALGEYAEKTYNKSSRLDVTLTSNHDNSATPLTVEPDSANVRHSIPVSVAVSVLADMTC